MKHPTISRLSMATAVGMTLSLLAMGDADAYTFSRLLDDSGPYNFDDFGTSYSYSPAINNQGNVAFVAALDLDQWPLPCCYDYPQDNFRNIIFKIESNSTSITRISPGFTRGGNVDINDQDTVVFSQLEGSPRTGTPTQAILTGNGGPLTTITRTSDYPGIFGNIAINNEGSVAFRGRAATRIFTSDGVTQTTIADDSGSLRSFGDLLAINNKGTVAFDAFLETGGRGIFTGNGEVVTPIADTNGSFSQFDSFSLNDSDTIAFAASLDDGSGGIFTSNGGSLTPLVDTSGAFSSLFSPAINNKGIVAFGAALDTGKSGIFTGSDPVADKVIAVGDQLFGSTVTSLGFFPKGFNDAGQVAFFAELADGTRGIFRADLDGVPIDLGGGGTGSKPAQATLKAIGIEDFSGQETLLDYASDSLSYYRSIPPAYIVNGVVHISFFKNSNQTQPSSEVSPKTNNVEPPNLTLGSFSGPMYVIFPEPQNRLGFGFALGPYDVDWWRDITFVKNAVTVELFDAYQNLLGTLSGDAKEDPLFPGGFFGVESTAPFLRAKITFRQGEEVAFDNLRYEFVTLPEPATVPEPATELGLLVISTIGVASALRRKQN
jgi:hypothetical protein